MEAGARAAHKAAGAPLSPTYMADIMRTQERMAQLKKWERDDKVKIEFATRYRTNTEEPIRATIVHVGELQFQDLHAQEVGSWPSEVLIAEIALALMAGQGNRGSNDR